MAYAEVISKWKQVKSGIEDPMASLGTSIFLEIVFLQQVIHCLQNWHLCFLPGDLEPLDYGDLFVLKRSALAGDAVGANKNIHGYHCFLKANNNFFGQYTLLYCWVEHGLCRRKLGFLIKLDDNKTLKKEYILS